LLLMRHGAALDGSDDHERPLTPAGARNAQRVGVWLAASDARPSLALCSSARRAQQTLEGVLGELPEPPEVRIDRALYLAGADALLQAIRGVEAGIDELLLVAHNPGVNALASEVVCSREAPTLRRGFPPGALAQIELAGDPWHRLRPGAGTLRSFRTPED
jgi:phosphohistidine phosphatase